jgi:predicted metal-dependent phosphoesterase TrpH
MIRNDLHVHSIQSLCGLHTILEIVQVASRKGMRLVNIADHGRTAGKRINVGVLADQRRLPDPVVALDGSSMRGSREMIGERELGGLRSVSQY